MNIEWSTCSDSALELYTLSDWLQCYKALNLYCYTNDHVGDFWNNGIWFGGFCAANKAECCYFASRVGGVCSVVGFLPKCIKARFMWVSEEGCDGIGSPRGVATTHCCPWELDFAQYTLSKHHSDIVAGNLIVSRTELAPPRDNYSNNWTINVLGELFNKLSMFLSINCVYFHDWRPQK